jgi:hypothetical protein
MDGVYGGDGGLLDSTAMVLALESSFAIVKGGEDLWS